MLLGMSSVHLLFWKNNCLNKLAKKQNILPTRLCQGMKPFVGQDGNLGGLAMKIFHRHGFLILTLNSLLIETILSHRLLPVV